MRMHVIRDVTSKTFEYRSRENPDLFAYAKKSHSGLFLEKIVVKNGGYKLVLQEEGALWSFLNAYCPWFPATHWSIYEENIKVGSIKSVYHSPKMYMHLKEDNYQIGGHSHEKFSLVKNGEQVAVWRQSISPYRDKCDYVIDYYEIEPLILFMVCTLRDRADYPNEIHKRSYDNPYSYITIVPFDDWKERAEWQPPVDSPIQEKKLLDEQNTPNNKL